MSITFAKFSILDVWQDSEYASQFEIFNPRKVQWNWIAFFKNSFVIPLGLIRHDTGCLANEAFTSDLIVSLKQWLSGLKITNCSAGSSKIEYDHSEKTFLSY